MPPLYPIGTRVYKEFPTYGWFWGTVTSCGHDNDEYYYDIQYTDGDCETLDDHEMAVVIQYAKEAEKESESTAVVEVSSSGGDDVEEDDDGDEEDRFKVPVGLEAIHIANHDASDDEPDNDAARELRMKQENQKAYFDTLDDILE